jgi:hypothetical protein
MYNISRHLMYTEPITVVVRSKTCTVFACYNAGIVCSNPTQGMDVCIVCVYSMFVFCCDGPIPRPRSPADCV